MILLLIQELISLQRNDYDIFMGSADPYAWRNIERGWAGGIWDGSKVPTTDWGSMVKQTGITHEHTLSASGGTEKCGAMRLLAI